MESRKVWVSQHEAEMETKCTLSTAQIPALPNHFISPVEIRDPISGKTVPESLFSLFPDLVCPIWLIYLLPPENTRHQVEHLFFISFLQEINSTQRKHACKHCQKSYRITQYSRHVTAWMLAAACCHEGLHTVPRLSLPSFPSLGIQTTGMVHFTLSSLSPFTLKIVYLLFQT